MVLLFSSLLREERNGRHLESTPLYTKDGESPFSTQHKKKELLSAGSWILIWNEVEKRVKKRYKMFSDSIKKQKEAKNEKG
jgi:hypothetical protein